MSQPATVLHQLMAVIEDRKANPPEKSYTTSLFAGGVEKIVEIAIDELEKGNGQPHWQLDPDT